MGGKIGTGCDGGWWGTGIVLFLDLGIGYTGVCSGKILNYRFDFFVYFSICYNFQLKILL